jgi:hypothetical protein
MAEYNRALLEPLVDRLADQERTIRDQAEQLGRLGVELETARAQLETEQRPWWRRLWA